MGILAIFLGAVKWKHWLEMGWHEPKNLAFLFLTLNKYLPAGLSNVNGILINLYPGSHQVLHEENRREKTGPNCFMSYNRLFFSKCKTYIQRKIQTRACFKH